MHVEKQQQQQKPCAFSTCIKRQNRHLVTLACSIHSWHASTPMSPQASPMACRRFTLV